MSNSASDPSIPVRIAGLWKEAAIRLLSWRMGRLLLINRHGSITLLRLCLCLCLHLLYPPLLSCTLLLLPVIDQQSQCCHEPADEQGLQYAVVDIAFTAAAVADHLLKEAQVVIPFEDPLSVLLVPEGPRLAVVLCDNFHYDYKPTEAQICKLQEYFGFNEPPTWMLDGNKRDWSDRKVSSG